MSRKLLVILPDSVEEVLEEVSVPDEQTLHKQLHRTPDLLPLEALGLDGPMLVVGQETGLASGRIDLVGLTRTGEVLLIEFKTGPQNPDFRAALAQLLDYGSDLWGVTVEGFDNAVVRRYLANTHCTNPAMKGATKLADAIHRAWPEIAADELDGLHARLSQVLAGGLFHFVVVAQRFTPSMENTVRYLNTRVGPGAFYLVELVRYEATTTSAFIGQVVAQPGTKIAAGTVTSISEEQFLASLSDESYRSALLRIFDTCKANGLQFKWQTKGASIRMPTPDRKDPLSIGWILPLGSTARGGARHLTLGVEPISLATTPSVTQAVTAYAEAALKLPGAVPAPAQSMQAAIFAPTVVIDIEMQLIELITQLVAAVNGEPAGGLSNEG